MQKQSCRACGKTQLERYLDLGFTPPADSFLRAASLREPETHYPLEVYVCLACGHSQLGYVVPPQILYQHDYPYESSTTAAGRTHFSGFAARAAKRLGMGGADLAVDIGSNVGVLLSGFKDCSCRVVGVEPAANIAATAVARGIPTINEFFTPEVARQIVSEHGRAKAITVTNCFAHIDDWDAMVSGVDELLTDDGALIIEAPHFLKLVQDLEYDTIYHEHLSYLTIRPLSGFFERHGFTIFDVEEVGIHGGSIRIWVARRDQHEVTDAPGAIVAEEEHAGLFSLDRLQQFAQDVSTHRAQLVDLLRKLREEGKSIAGVSAPAKGMTLLNYCRIGPELLDFVTEKSALKIDRYTPGMHHRVLPDSALTEHRPDYALLLAWNFADEIMANLSEFRANGGRFIIPIPEPRIVS